MLKFDLDLLLIFDEIYKTASLTQSAENLGIAQPTVSVALAKLRQHFDDPLFIRTSKGMQPTPMADSVIDDVRATTAALHKTLSPRIPFDPSAAEREFRIGMTDISEIVLLPTLLNHLQGVAPGVRLNVLKISPETPRQLELGEVDLAVGFMPHLEAGFYQQKLFEQNFVCLVARDHPRITSSLSKRAFLREGHILIKSSGTGHSIVERTMEKENIVRKIVLQAPSFLSVARIVAQTEFIATVPERYGSASAAQEKVRLFRPPVKLPSYSVKQHWHERFHRDSANGWLRQVMRQLFVD